jgi:hypothetical protein
MQRRKNSHGNYLELSEYEGKGHRSFVIISEGHEGKGWKECRSQLQRLKLHYEKNREGMSTGEASEERKQIGQPCGGRPRRCNWWGFRTGDRMQWRWLGKKSRPEILHKQPVRGVQN